MKTKNERVVDCLSDDMLAAYIKRELPDKEREAVSSHLLFCNSCLAYAKLLLWDSNYDIEETDVEEYDFTRPVEITPVIAEAQKRFQAYRQRRREFPAKSLSEIGWDGLKVGQIWRTKFEGIVVPTAEGEEVFSATELNSNPHLVVITDRNVAVQPLDSKTYHVISVAPIDSDIDYADEDKEDLIIPEDETPLGYSFMVQLWNKKPMLFENLDSCLGEINQNSLTKLLGALNQSEEGKLIGDEFSPEAVIIRGEFHNPIMRYRAKEYEDTKYLRMPVEQLFESLSGEDIGVELPVDPLPRLPDWFHPQYGAVGQPLYMAAQQESKTGWPLEARLDINIRGNFLPIELEFKWRGSSLIVEAGGSWDVAEVVLPMEKLNRKIHLSRNTKAILGSLEEFNLTVNSSKEEIITALVSAGLGQPYAGEIT